MADVFPDALGRRDEDHERLEEIIGRECAAAHGPATTLGVDPRRAAPAHALTPPGADIASLGTHAWFRGSARRGAGG